MNPGAKKMKMGPDALGTEENESESAKHENGTLITAKKCSGAQVMTRGPDALGTAENESESAKREKGTRHPRYRQK
jgi:hypothetical protein